MDRPTLLALLLASAATIAAAPSVERTTAAPARAPTTRPDVRSMVLGTFKGKVRDDGSIVSIVTTIQLDRYEHVAGVYRIGTGDDAYDGTLADFKVTDGAKRTCRFTWHDKHGTGTVTMTLAEDGQTFTGHWGPDGEAETEPWEGKRAEAYPTTQRRALAPGVQGSQYGTAEAHLLWRR